ncbi:type I secretion target repeat protein [Thalassobium sp. R2A62]|nr:type I secretion target repeat protein [Thalassobium sp. R2A62]
MAIYTFTIYQATSITTGPITLSGNAVTITVDDPDDSQGIGDLLTDGSGHDVETGITPSITAVSDPAYSYLIGDGLTFNGQWAIDGLSGTGWNALILNDEDGSNNASFHGTMWLASHPDNPTALADAFISGSNVGIGSRTDVDSVPELVPPAPVETYTFHTFSQSDVGFPQTSAFSKDGIVFVHDSTNPITTIAVDDDDAVLDDQSTNDGQTYDSSEILQSVNGDTSISGNDIASFASYTVTGDDGSSFKAYIIAGSNGTNIRDIDGSALTGFDTYITFTQPLIDGVEYTYSEYSPIGQVAYADLAEQGTFDIVGTPPESPEAGLSISEAIFLGNFMDADTSEEFFPDTVNTAPFLGTFGSSSDPLWQDEVLVTYEDVNGDGAINTDNLSPQYLPDEEISYDLGSGTQTALVDSIVSINLTVTYTDGSTQSYTNALMYQDDAGNMFLVNSDWAGTNLNSGSWPQIQSIDVTSVTDGYHGAMTQDDFQSFVCFTRGTLIKTDQGERPIEELAAGDMVLTMDHGYQPIRWIGSSKRAATGDLAPILIRRGALGNDRDLRVSPQHRMLLQGWQAELLFGEVEVLATAKSLLNDQTILRDEGGEVEYFHMLFDTHEIIYAEGCPSESFHPGQQGWKALDQATRDEILTLFPQLVDGTLNDYGPAARMSLKHKEGKLLGSYMAGSV